MVLKRQTPEGEVGCVVPLHKELALQYFAEDLRQAKSRLKFMEKL